MTLDGTASTGPALAYHWSAPGVTFDDPSSPTPTGLFPSGVTNVVLGITTGLATALDTVRVTVADTHAPTLALTVDPAVLWPPNHSLRDVSVTVDTRDGCDPHPALRLLSVTSSEPESGLEKGDAAPDIVGAETGTDDRAFSLRAERLGSGPGRTYEVCYEARDASGNATTECVTVAVPHDSRMRSGGAGRNSDAPLTDGTAARPGDAALVFSATVRPNPARLDAALDLTLPASGMVRVTIFDLAGHAVLIPVNGWRPAGHVTERLGPLRGPQVCWYRAEWRGQRVEGKLVVLR